MGAETDRWEPPVARQADGARPRRRRRGQANWSAALELSAGRILAAFLFVVGGLARAPSFWLPVAGSALVIGLILAGVYYRGEARSSDRVVWLADAATLGFTIPLLLINAFAATGAEPLQSAEQSVYLQTAGVAALALVILAAGVAWRAGADQLLASVALLPAALAVPALAEAHRDLRDATVAASLALAWLFAALVALIARRVGGRPGQLLAPLSFAGFTLVILVSDPGFASFGGRGMPVGLVEPLLILLAGLALVVVVARPDPAGRGPRGRRARRERVRGHRRRASTEVSVRTPEEST